MMMRNLVLGSVASFAVAGFLSVPVNAQYLPRYSTPEEHAQTERLNAQQATAPSIVITVNPADDAAYRSALAAHDAALAQQRSAEAQYNAQVQDYQQKNGAYADQKKDYQ